jgi:hypothetical protein
MLQEKTVMNKGVIFTPDSWAGREVYFERVFREVRLAFGKQLSIRLTPLRPLSFPALVLIELFSKSSF